MPSVLQLLVLLLRAAHFAGRGPGCAVASGPRAGPVLNPGNPLSHYDGTAEEILRQTNGQVWRLLLAIELLERTFASSRARNQLPISPCQKIMIQFRLLISLIPGCEL